jgi:hypothetical protein
MVSAGDFLARQLEIRYKLTMQFDFCQFAKL